MHLCSRELFNNAENFMKVAKSGKSLLKLLDLPELAEKSKPLWIVKFESLDDRKQNSAINYKKIFE